MVSLLTIFRLKKFYFGKSRCNKLGKKRPVEYNFLNVFLNDQHKIEKVSKNLEMHHKRPSRNPRNSHIYNPTMKPLSKTFSHHEYFEYYKNLLTQDNDNLKRSTFNRMIEAMSAQLPQFYRVTADGDHKNALKDEIENFLPHLKRQKVKGQIIQCLEEKYGIFAQIFFSPAFVRSNPNLEEYFEWFNLNSQAGFLTKIELSSLLPFIFLDIQPDNSILSVSKNNPRVIEIVDEILDSGFLVMNEPDVKRAKTDLQIHSPNNLVISYPVVNIPEIQQFDKVVCYLPSSDDGAIRNKPGVKSIWSVNNAVDNHDRLKKQLLHSLELTKVGGLCVYATNSISPFENEAVINTVLKALKGKLELVDCSEMFKTIKRKKGLTSWNLHHVSKRELATLTSIDCKEVIDNIELCMRFYPHQIHCSGTFIAVIKKLDNIDINEVVSTTAENENQTNNSKNNHKNHNSKGQNEDENNKVWVSNLSRTPEEVVSRFVEDFGLPNEVKDDYYIQNDSHNLSINFRVVKGINDFLTDDLLKDLRITHVGARGFSFSPNYVNEPSIPNVASLPEAAKNPTKRLITFTLDNFRELSESCQLNVSKLNEENQQILKETTTGGIFIAVEGYGIAVGGLYKDPFIRVIVKKGIVNKILTLIEMALAPEPEQGNEQDGEIDNEMIQDDQENAEEEEEEEANEQ
ncbi:hypothetical protein TRFO_13629 [Tritrichomonas foetus]|uniref:SAM-dependent MTase RsmB/NOP-type domain-containing protein n=1 Tax=Tritrichomonas foetus TaxID=1144522 RepID=A0A1J4KXP2_9EUKA|nr:hypothetical protein TRFO_13629 [Tritrichomonas foetus]|eukprot:OHT15946.1 hypothetical protein TRFO_13629 [Tritrichomonas foetus]